MRYVFVIYGTCLSCGEYCSNLSAVRPGYQHIEILVARNQWDISPELFRELLTFKSSSSAFPERSGQAVPQDGNGDLLHS